MGEGNSTEELFNRAKKCLQEIGDLALKSVKFDETTKFYGADKDIGSEGIGSFGTACIASTLISCSYYCDQNKRYDYLFKASKCIETLLDWSQFWCPTQKAWSTRTLKGKGYALVNLNCYILNAIFEAKNSGIRLAPWVNLPEKKIKQSLSFLKRIQAKDKGYWPPINNSIDYSITATCNALITLKNARSFLKDDCLDPDKLAKLKNWLSEIKKDGGYGLPNEKPKIGVNAMVILAALGLEGYNDIYLQELVDIQNTLEKIQKSGNNDELSPLRESFRIPVLEIEEVYHVFTPALAARALIEAGIPINDEGLALIVNYLIEKWDAEKWRPKDFKGPAAYYLKHGSFALRIFLDSFMRSRLSEELKNFNNQIQLVIKDIVELQSRLDSIERRVFFKKILKRRISLVFQELRSWVQNMFQKWILFRTVVFIVIILVEFALFFGILYVVLLNVFPEAAATALSICISMVLSWCFNPEHIERLLYKVFRKRKN